MPHRRLALLVVAIATLAIPAAAHAGTAKVETYQTCVDLAACKYFQYVTRQAVGFTAAAGEVNNVTLSRSGSIVTVRDDSAPVTPDVGCTRVSDNEAACTVDTTFYNAGATLGDQHDKLTVSGELGVRFSASGGEGNDQLTGGAEIDNFDGGPGLDVIIAGAGADTVSGGDDLDADTIDGGADGDLLDYSERKAPVSVNLALATPVQGGAGEKETVFGVEDVTGGAGGDVLRGDGGPNVISGGAGGDRLFGAAGADELTGGSGVDSFDGGPGNDSLRTMDQNSGLERVTCGSGRDTVGQAEPGEPYGSLEEPDYFGPDARDLLGSDCERAFVADGLTVRLVIDPRLRKLSSVALAIANPCRGRRGCSGRVRIAVPGVRRAVGQARFTRRGRLVPVGISLVGERAVQQRKVLAVSLRVADPTRSNETYVGSYRTRAAR